MSTSDFGIILEIFGFILMLIYITKLRNLNRSNMIVNIKQEDVITKRSYYEYGGGLIVAGLFLQLNIVTLIFNIK